MMLNCTDFRVQYFIANLIAINNNSILECMSVCHWYILFYYNLIVAFVSYCFSLSSRAISFSISRHSSHFYFHNSNAHVAQFNYAGHAVQLGFPVTEFNGKLLAYLPVICECALIHLTLSSQARTGEWVTWTCFHYISILNKKNKIK